VKGTCKEKTGECVECLAGKDCAPLGMDTCVKEKCSCVLKCMDGGYSISCGTGMTELSCFTWYDGKGNPTEKDCLVDLGELQVHVVTTWTWKGGALVSITVSVKEWPGQTCKL
jgi:hypothetical protein